MKEEWLLLSKFQFKEKRYLLFLNKKGLKFFLEEKNGKVFYPMIDDFLELYRLFNLQDKKVFYLQEKDRKAEGKKAKWYSFIPKVWLKRGALLSLSAALSYGGLVTPIKYIEKAYGSEVEYGDEQTSEVLRLLEILRNGNGYEVFSVDSDGNELDVYEGEFSEPVSESMTFYVHSLKVGDSMDIEGKSMDEVKSFMTNSNPSVEECKRAVDENPDIPEEYRKYFYEFLDDVHENIPDFNLSLFYFNVKRGLFLQHGTPEAIEANYGKGNKGSYNSTKNMLVVPNVPTEGSTPEETEDFYHTFYHELAHVCNSVDININDENKDKLDKDLYQIFFDKMKEENVNKLGFSFENGNMQILELYVGEMNYNEYDIAAVLSEGMAEEFVNVARGKKVQNNCYNESQMLIETYCAIAGVPFEDVLNKGTYFLMEKVKENGIENPLFYVALNDQLNGYEVEETDKFAPILEKKYSTTDLFAMLGEEYINSEIKKGKSYEEAKEMYVSFLKESGVYENLPESIWTDETHLHTDTQNIDLYTEKIGRKTDELFGITQKNKTQEDEGR